MKPFPGRFENLARLMREKAPERSFGNGISAQEVAQCEEQLGVTLPQSYRSFLREFGFSGWPDYIYGVLPGPKPGLNVIRTTEWERDDAEPAMPHDLIPFGPDGWGNHYCLDTSRLKDGECPVVFWNHELDEDQQPPQTHPSFLDWLEEKVARALESEADDRSPS